MVVISHGFSEEVIATFITNQQRGALDIFPIRIVSDLESINTIADLSVVCETTPICSFKGDLLVFKKFEDLPEIDHIRATMKETTIENSGNKTALNDHIRALLEKRSNNSAIEDVQNLIDKRLRSMVANAVVIYLPEMTTLTRDAIRVKIDNALRASKTLLNYGVVNVKNVIDELKPESHLEHIISNALKFLGGEYKDIPALSLYVALLISGKSMISLLSSSGVVIKED